jgi:hypothetical protein
MKAWLKSGTQLSVGPVARVWIAVGTAIVLAAIAVSWAVDGASAGQSSATSSSDVVAEQQQSMDQNLQGFIDRAQSIAPAPYYDPETRAKLVDSMNVYAHCMQRSGVPEFPETPSSFGDGQTPVQIIGGPSTSPLSADSQAMQRATESCGAELEALHAATLAANGFDPHQPPVN